MRPISFGKPGRMGTAKLVLSARKKNNGFTVCEGGPAVNEKGEPGYWGIRFCVLTGGAKQCGVHKVMTWKKYPCAPVCEECLKIVDGVLTPAYFRRYPEIRRYFDWAQRAFENKQPAPTAVWDADEGAPKIIRERAVDEITTFCNCVDYETEALTKRGWLRGQEITDKDEILTKNIDTGALEWQHPSKLNHYPDYNGPLVQFESKTLSAVTTPNHRWMVSDKKGKTICVTSASLSRNGDHKIHRTGGWCEPDGQYSDDFLELAGWFLTDGSLGSDTSIRIYQTKENNVARIDKLFERLDIGVKRYVSRGAVVWQFCANPRRPSNPDLNRSVRSSPTGKLGPKGNTEADYYKAGVGEELDAIVARRLGVVTPVVAAFRKRRSIAAPIGQRPDGKGYALRLRQLFPDRILTPTFVTTLSRRQAEALLAVMLLGDGTRKKTNHCVSFYTRSSDSASAVQMLAVALS